MSGQPQAAEWEYLVEGDLAPHLLPRQGSGRSGPAAAFPRPPEGAQEGLAASLGPVRPEDLLVIPAAAWPLGGWRRRCLYSPLCVVAIGEQAVALWVRDLPLPDVRARVALDDVALIEHRTAGSRRALTVTARSGHVVVRCDEAQRSPLDRWTRRLRLRLAPPGNPASAGNAAGPDLDAFLPAADEGIVAFGHRGGRLRRCCLLTVTSRELIIEQSWRDRGRPWRWLSRTLYLPRQAMSSSAARGKTLRLESAGTAVRVRLPARKTAAAAAAWLASELSGRTSNVS